MRITTGKYRNRKLHVPRGIRPTQDKVRKAIFDILGDVSGLVFLELFAGSGAVGFEALSRGVSELVMIESNRDAVLAIKRNIEQLKAGGCNLFHLEAEKGVKLLFLDKKQFDIVFVDPPYCKDMAKKILQTLEGYDILAPHGLIVIQHSKAELLPEESPKFDLIKEARYGDTRLSIFRKKE
ncbi:MAG: 16S rRNA (guanine(966)-N(2))-methyltransferase RsmD [Candidatus Omnitrophica bacterium]|jgi:16S rRNA (guanine(966)-N(2))-methyltransferase RsmD|nr:16S rRNA (guanine(966)-N(2))-methyltransferase RsmD [Candidatus Omnitrophota bacterium]MDD5661198.1 16S rRNA (guanine(966)-N(2))-methyltransferase RsmD [Candidatus Omnitrophota bacterium]